MKLLIVFLFNIIILITPTFAETNTYKTITVKVNGLVCDFCARATEKVFAKEKAVEKIKVDLDAGLVTIIIKPNQTMDDATIKTLINNSGYDVVSINHIQ